MKKQAAPGIGTKEGGGKHETSPVFGVISESATVPARSAGQHDVVLTVAPVGVPPAESLCPWSTCASHVAAGALAAAPLLSNTI
jgi:hypothetical protein